MLCVAIYSTVYIFVIIFELIPVYKAKRIKDGIIYSCILIFAFFIEVLYTKGINFLNPITLITNIVKFFTE
jgi:hypothetical protein